MVTAKTPSVIVYSTTTCPWCVRAKNYLKQKGVNYIEFNVATDEKARNEMLAKSGQMGVPQLDINGKIIVGFDQEAIDKALGA
ncbi:glutaredoxin family protein [Candidatus Woesearchaeota archaeon]|nr:glutaredoxin family protein [Candidatus Woesearchaeota archaeon]